MVTVTIHTVTMVPPLSGILLNKLMVLIPMSPCQGVGTICLAVAQGSIRNMIVSHLLLIYISPAPDHNEIERLPSKNRTSPDCWAAAQSHTINSLACNCKPVILIQPIVIAWFLKFFIILPLVLTDGIHYLDTVKRGVAKAVRFSLTDRAGNGT